MIQDLCVIMLTAGITSLLFKLFKQPVVLGYIVAGILVGPYVCGESWISNVESVDTWGQIGVLFLLFAMGLEFSFKKLLKVGSTAIVAAATIVVGMMTLGFLLGRLLGWNEINSLFLGGMLCMSSTTIVFKAVEDMGLGSHKFAKICFGILIVEDLFAVVLMVLLSSIAVKRSFEGTEMLFQVLKLVTYLVFWFVVGIAVIPTFLSKFRKHLNDETLTIFSIGLCLGMVMLAVSAGFSSALGAFVMGSVLAETVEAERIEHLIQPVKNIFGAIFFVSVGMMINPDQLLQYWIPILVISALVVFGQIFFGSLGTLLSGQSLKVSLQSGFSLVQIGEFAFIIAALGQSLKVTDESLYPIVVAVSVITTFLTPYIMRLALPADKFIESHMSNGVKLFLENYAKSRNTVTIQSTWKRLLRKVLTSLFIYGVITMFINLLYFKYVYVLLYDLFDSFTPHWIIQSVGLIILLGVTSPFIYIIATCYRKIPEARELRRTGNFEKGSLFGLSLLCILVSVALVAYDIITIFTITFGLVAVLSLLLVIGIMFSHRISKGSRQLELKFTENLNAREKNADAKRSIHKGFVKSLLNYDVHISETKITPNSSFCGNTLKGLNIRSKSGVSIVRIVRGGININIPGGNEVLYPGDTVVMAGSDEQIDKFQKMLDSSMQPNSQAKGRKSRIVMERFIVAANNPLIGKTIIESSIREKADCIIMGVEREGEYIMNPNPKLEFKENDVVIMAGELDKIRIFIESLFKDKNSESND